MGSGESGASGRIKEGPKAKRRERMRHPKRSKQSTAKSFSGGRRDFRYWGPKRQADTCTPSQQRRAAARALCTAGLGKVEALRVGLRRARQPVGGKASYLIAHDVRYGSEPEVNANPKVGPLCASKRTPAQSLVGILAKISAFYFEDEQSEAGRRRQRKWVPLK